MFGCLCYPYTGPYSYSKLDLRSVPYVFLGYPKHQKGYLPQSLSRITNDKSQSTESSVHFV